MTSVVGRIAAAPAALVLGVVVLVLVLTVTDARAAARRTTATKAPPRVLSPPSTTSAPPATATSTHQTHQTPANTAQTRTQPRVVYVHGISPQGAAHPRGALVRETLEAAGFDVDCPDVTGGRASYTACSISNAIETLEAASRDGPVRLVASSWGAFVALLWAKRRPDKVADLFLLGPAFDMKANLKLFNVDDVALEQWRRTGVREMGPGVRVGWDWVREIVELPDEECPPRPRCPVTAFVPSNDVKRAPKGLFDSSPDSRHPSVATAGETAALLPEGQLEDHRKNNMPDSSTRNERDHQQTSELSSSRDATTRSAWRLIAVDGWSPYEEDRGIEQLMPHLLAWARRGAALEKTAGTKDAASSSALRNVEVVSESPGAPPPMKQHTHHPSDVDHLPEDTIDGIPVYRLSVTPTTKHHNV